MTSSVTRPTRRTLVKGAAWSVPVVAMAGAAPAFAASGNPPTVAVGGACKLPGNSCGNVFVKGYVFDVTITNVSDKPIYIYNNITFTENNPDIDLFFQAAVDATTGDVLTFPVLLQPGQSLAIVLNAGENGNSANQSLAGTMSVPWGHTPDPAGDTEHVPVVVPFSFAATPPVQNPACTVVLPPNCG